MHANIIIMYPAPDNLGIILHSGSVILSNTVWYYNDDILSNQKIHGIRPI